MSFVDLKVMEQSIVDEEQMETYSNDGDLSSVEEESVSNNIKEEVADADNEDDAWPSVDVSVQEHSNDKDESDMVDELQPLRYHTRRVLKYQTPPSSLEPLPEGWLAVRHSSGIPVYLHRETRVVTWSRPYVVSAGGIRKHNPPVTSIPCLEYKRLRESFKKELQKDDSDSNPASSMLHCNGVNSDEGNNPDDQSREEHNDVSENTPDDQSNSASNASIDIVPKAILHSCANEQLGSEEFGEYLGRCFEFDVLQIPQFNKWSEKRQFNRRLKRSANASTEEKDESDPKKLGPAKVITLTIPRESGSDRPQKVVFNTSVKPMVCVLHEYAQSVLRAKAHYVFKTKGDSTEPFETTIMINDKAYGTAAGINKKTAKNKAALETMEMLVPGFKKQVESLSGETSIEYFNDVPITDSRVYNLCLHAGYYLPYHLLTECLKRNQGITDTNVKFDVQVGKGKSLEYKMECGKHIVTGSAKNKKIAKQLASQQILQRLHPKATFWGELMEMYGTSVAEKRAKKKNIEQEIFELKRRGASSSKASTDEVDRTVARASSGAGSSGYAKGRDLAGPNPELLSKLRKMMMELGERSANPDHDRNTEQGTVSDESPEPEKKKSKLLMIDV